MKPERNLFGSVKQVQSVAKPVLGLRGFRGRWKQQAVQLGGAVFDAIFFIGNGLVQGIEMSSTAEDIMCRSREPALVAIAAIDAWHGVPAQLSSLDCAGYQQEIALWSRFGLDVLVLSKISSDFYVTKVIFKNRHLKDGAQL